MKKWILSKLPTIALTAVLSAFGIAASYNNSVINWITLPKDRTKIEKLVQNGEFKEAESS